MQSDDRIILTILLPAYNAEPYIEAAIDGILGQSFTDFELLIADDGSSDNTKALIDAYDDARLSCYHNEENLGKNATVDRLYPLARGKYISIHDADDISLKERFEKQIQLLEQEPELAMCGCSFFHIDEEGREILEPHIMPSDYSLIVKDIKRASQFHGPTMVIRKTVLDELGEIYRPFFKNHSEDVDLAYRIVERYKAINLREPLYKYRVLRNSLCRNEVTVWNRNLYKLVVFLAEQRAEEGTDYLQQGREDLLMAYFDDITAHYAEDTTLIKREAAGYYNAWKLFDKAVEVSWEAVKKEPARLVNWRTWFYCLRRKWKGE